MKIRIAGFQKESIVDGEGIRFVIFTQGCPHHCPGCQNPETHDFNSGTEYDTEDIVKMFSQNPLISGITLSGGDPFCQREACQELARKAHEMNLNVWCFTGFTYEEVIKDFGCSLLSEVDVLVDGRFDLSQRTLLLPFRGSSNQRLINVPESLKQNRVVLH